MSKKLLLLPLISCVLLASCTEEGANDTTIELPKQAQGKTITFKASPLSVETKSLSTKVEVIPNGNSDDLEWSDEAVSFFFYDNIARKQFFDEAIVTPIFGGADMDVTVPEDEGSYGVYAISPSGSYFTDNRSTTTLTIDNQTQDGTDLSHLSPYVFLYSHPENKLEVDNKGNSIGDIPLNFDVLASLIRFDVVNNSNTAVTLNSITVKFDGGGTLYKTATLNDLDGTLSYGNSEVHGEMTLTLENASLIANAGASRAYRAYMATFPSNGKGDLLIDLNVTANGVSFTIEYKLADSEILEGKRLYVGLDIIATDIPNADGSKYMTNGNNMYLTYQYPTTLTGGLQTWMIENSIEGSPDNAGVGFGALYYPASSASACVYPWRLPTVADYTRLLPLLVDESHLWAQVQESAGFYYMNSWSSHIQVRIWLSDSNNTLMFTLPSGSFDISNAQRWGGAGPIGSYVRCIRD